ncbi:MAG: DUF3108 domain-containing protein [Prevotellaceae bacterium]|jgi:hypothetical protein|nr:DUF3108 domain-containing protein [Prevotellaceae bacterium]
MNTKKILLLISLLTVNAVLSAQVTSFNDCENMKNPANFAFQNGEAITLEANYKWGLVNTAVGEAVLKLSKEDYNNQIHFVSSVNIRTYGFFDAFFKVRDHFISKFNAENMKPSYFYQDTHEGKYTKKSTMHFDWKNNKLSGKKQRKKSPEREYSIDLKGCTFDFISFLYFLRNMDFNSINANSNLLVTFALDDILKTLNVRYAGTKTIKTKAGKFNAIEIIVQLLENDTFASEPEMSLFLSNDKNHIPLYAEMPLRIGKVYISLSNFNNLKYPVTSKLK